MNIFLFLSLVFLFTFLLGRLMERIRVPWIFSALIIGALLSLFNPFSSVTSSSTFDFLANMGMYFLLFIIGFEIDLNELKKKSRFILKTTFFIILLEALFGSMLIHFIFGYEWIISFLVALSFATVGEAVLIPILDEFKATNTKLGQTTIGIGMMDDIIEVALLVLVIITIGSQSHGHMNALIALGSLFTLFVLTVGFTKFREKGKRFSVFNLESTFLFVIFILFFFLGIGMFAEATSLAALLAGIGVKTFIPRKRLRSIESEVKAVCYGFFAPIFFLWAGLGMDLYSLITSPLLVVSLVIVTSAGKILGSYASTRKYLGGRGSILLGIGLSVRFSTSIVIMKILLKNGIIGTELYSMVVASSILFMFIVPVVFSNLLVKWGTGRGKANNI
ncbi:MAG: hypothetical protein DRO99_00395 [Candidatus Aenigmatarchaeota archaeon]|nr:MAG: hypothetical protein DRO99_00395 [Candidatus Aenigmarchaeota archaeon]